jgi:hypothetical protein
VSVAMLTYTGEQYHWVMELLKENKKSENDTYCVDLCSFRRLREYCWKLR